MCAQYDKGSLRSSNGHGLGMMPCAAPTCTAQHPWGVGLCHKAPFIPCVLPDKKVCRDAGAASSGSSLLGDLCVYVCM